VIFVAYLLGFLAACADAAANVLQRVANRDESIDRQFSLRLIADLVRKPVWLAGIGAVAGAFFLQAAGLGIGTLAGVQPLLVLELPLTMVASRWFLGGNLGRREWLAICGMSGGTIALIAFLSPRGGDTVNIAWWVWLIGVSANSALIGTAYWLGHHWEDQARRAAVLGVGTGLSYGMAAALIKGMTVQFSDGGIVAVLTAWQLYGAIAAGIFAIWMHQNALGAGRLAVAQPGVTLADPYLSIVWGAAVFHETMRTGFWIVLVVLAAAVMSVSVIVLAGSKETTGANATSETGGEESDRTSPDAA
jgi:drug/metabolite transporter (DMT)-like permease